MGKIALILSGLFLTTTVTLNANIDLLNNSKSEQDIQFQKMQDELFNFFNMNGTSNIVRDLQKLQRNAFINYPKMDTFESNDSYTYEFSLAGMEKKDIKVEISDNNVLSISGEHKRYTKTKKDSMTSQERYYGKFQRLIKLPKDIDPNKIDITFKNAVLKVVIQKDKQKVKNNSRILQIK